MGEKGREKGKDGRREKRGRGKKEGKEAVNR